MVYMPPPVTGDAMADGEAKRRIEQITIEGGADHTAGWVGSDDLPFVFFLHLPHVHEHGCLPG